MKAWKILTFSTLLLVIFAFNANVEAGSGLRKGTAGATELLIPVGARSTALGGAFTSGISGVEALYWNPAGVATSDVRTEVMFSHLNWIADIDVEYAAAIYQVGEFGYIGASFKSIGFGDIEETTVDNPDGTGNTFSPGYLTIGVTYARAMTDRILFGVTGKLISEKIMRESAMGMGFDFGLQYLSGIQGLKLGVAMCNLGANMKFDGQDLEHAVLLPGTEAGAEEEAIRTRLASFDLPSYLQLGVSYDYPVNDVHMVTVMGSYQNNGYSYDQYNMGLEYNYDGMLFLRGAFSAAYREDHPLAEDNSDYDNGFVTGDQEYLWGPSFGAGLNFNVTPTMRLSFDYAYRVAEFFDAPQWFTLTAGF
jgi:hypothetical protein